MAESKNARKTKYNKKTYDTLLFRIRRDGADGVTVEEIKSAAARAGMSQNAFILDVIRDKLSSSAPDILSIKTDPNGYVTIDESIFDDLWGDDETTP